MLNYTEIGQMHKQQYIIAMWTPQKQADLYTTHGTKMWLVNLFSVEYSANWVQQGLTYANTANKLHCFLFVLQVENFEI